MSIPYIFVELRPAPKPVQTWFVFETRLLSGVVLRLPMRTNNRSQIRSLSYPDWCWTSDFQGPSVRQRWRVGQLSVRPLQVGQECRLEYTRPSVFRVTNQKLTTWQNGPKRAYPLQSLAFMDDGPTAHRKIIFIEKNRNRRNGAWESVGTTGDFGAVTTGEIRSAGGDHISNSNQVLSSCPSSAKGLTVDDRTTVPINMRWIPEAGRRLPRSLGLPKYLSRDTVFPHFLTKQNGLTNSDLFRRRSAN